MYHFAFYLYALVGVVAGPLICVFAWLAFAQARRRRLTTQVRWLAPLAVGSTLSMLAVLLAIGASLLRVRDVGVYTIPYLLSAISAPFSAVAIIRLWKMLRALPVSTGAAPPPPPSGPNERIWPPPPRTRAS